MNKQQLLLQERFSEKIKFSEEYLNKYEGTVSGIDTIVDSNFFPRK